MLFRQGPGLHSPSQTTLAASTCCVRQLPVFSEQRGTGRGPQPDRTPKMEKRPIKTSIILELQWPGDYHTAWRLRTRHQKWSFVPLHLMYSNYYTLTPCSFMDRIHVTTPTKRKRIPSSKLEMGRADMHIFYNAWIESDITLGKRNLTISQFAQLRITF